MYIFRYGLYFWNAVSSKGIRVFHKLQIKKIRLRRFFLQGMLSQLRNFYIRVSQKRGGEFARGRDFFYQLPMALGR